MNKYESVIIINPRVDEEGLKALEGKFKGLIEEHGKVEKVTNMGLKKLAYEIKKCKEAHYLVFNYEADPNSIAEFERILRITDDVLKFVVIRNED